MVLGRDRRRCCRSRIPRRCGNWRGGNVLRNKVMPVCSKGLPDFIRPDSNHSPERYQDRDDIRNHKLCVRKPISPSGCYKQKPSLTIRFVLIFQYLWIYQKPSVLAVEVIAGANPRYVFCKKLNWNLSFWQIDTRVPVVFNPCNP